MQTMDSSNLIATVERLLVNAGTFYAAGIKYILRLCFSALGTEQNFECSVVMRINNRKD